jgi:hypothetical protein
LTGEHNCNELSWMLHNNTCGASLSRYRFMPIKQYVHVPNLDLTHDLTDAEWYKMLTLLTLFICTRSPEPAAPATNSSVNEMIVRLFSRSNHTVPIT